MASNFKATRTFKLMTDTFNVLTHILVNYIDLYQVFQANICYESTNKTCFAIA